MDRPKPAPTRSVHLIGTHISPFVCKVLIVLELKGVPYTIDPIVPATGGPRFTELNPLRFVPVLVDGELTLPDSTVICEYLEELYPSPSLYPRDAATRARMRWIEEFVDTQMGEHLIRQLFTHEVLIPLVTGNHGDPEIIRVSRGQAVAMYDYLERQLPEAGFLFGDLSIADITLGAMYSNISHLSQGAIDPRRWPRMAAHARRLLTLEVFRRFDGIKRRLVQTPFAAHRRVLKESGEPVTEETVAVVEG